MLPSLESSRQWWESFSNENIEGDPYIANTDGIHTYGYQQNTVWEEICDAISGDSRSTYFISDDEDSTTASQEIKYRLEGFCQGIQNNDMFTRDHNLLGSNFGTSINIIESNQLDYSDDDSLVLDLSTKNTNKYFRGTDVSKTSKVNFLNGCESANVLDNYTSKVYLNNKEVINNTYQYDTLPIYNLTTSSNENEVLGLMLHETNNALLMGCANSIIYQDSGQSEILDLSMPKNNKGRVHSEHIKLLEINDNEMVDIDSDLIPHDLPDLRLSHINLNVSLVKSRNQRWIHSVRRRMLYISTLRKMFGLLNEQDTEITLLYGGRGLKNPLKSNIPSIANHANFHRKYICMYCEKEFKNHKVLSRHYTQHTTYRKLFCVICWKGFYDSYDLKRHLEKHQEITVFYCELCEAIYTQNISKETHYRNIHKNIYFSST